MEKAPGKPDFSLVLACYREEDHLRNSVQEIQRVLDMCRFSYEIIFIDDKSPDNTRAIIEDIVNKDKNHSYKTIFHEENTGRGGAVTSGIKKASADRVGYIDVDLEVSPLYIPYLLSKLDEGSDIVIGARVYKIQWGGTFRYLTHWVYLQLVRHLVGVKFLKDTETGYKVFKRDKILKVLNSCEDTHWFWSTELVANAYLQGLRFSQVPCLYIRKKDKKTTVKVVKDSWLYFKALLDFFMKNRKNLKARRSENRDGN